MRNHKGKLPALRPNIEYLILHIHAGECVKRAQRLVQQQYLRFVYKRAHQRHALRHSAGKLGRIVVAELFKAGYFKHMLYLFGLANGCAPHIKAEGYVLFNGEPGEKRWVLENQSALRARAVHLFAVNGNAAERWRYKPRNKAQYCGFPAAGRADQGHELPALHFGANVLQGVGHAVAFNLCKNLAYVFQFKANLLLIVAHFSAPFCHLRR